MAMFRHCKRAELPDLKTGRPVQAAVNLAATGGLLLTVPREAEYPTNKPIEITFYDPVMGVVRCRCLLSSPLVSSDHRSRSYRCEVVEQLSQEQRREDAKVSLSVQTEISLEGRRAPAAIYNISASGVYLASDLLAQVGDKLSFDFRETRTVIPLVAKVLRTELRSGRYHYGYGCKFLGLSSRQESALRSYVFQEQRRLYK